MSDTDPPESPSAASTADGGLTPSQYWRKNITCVLALLAVWFTVSYGFSILLVDQLDKIQIPGTGFKLGFWFAQQGSIYVFVVLIAVYVLYMNKLDRQFKGR